VVPRTQQPADPIGLGLSGSWIELEPLTDATAAEFGELSRRWRLDAAMGGALREGASAFAPPMLIRERRQGRAVGLVVNQRVPADVAAFLIYVDPERGRAGFGIEATALYVSHLFDSGARLVTADVLSFNTAVNGILAKAGLAPQARLREHVYVAGGFWDVLVYSFGVEEWLRALARYRRHLPGGDRRPAALGTLRPAD
jgi:RimJ/RimL family protein N-acetyltransferase